LPKCVLVKVTCGLVCVAKLCVQYFSYTAVDINLSKYGLCVIKACVQVLFLPRDAVLIAERGIYYGSSVRPSVRHSYTCALYQNG